MNDEESEKLKAILFDLIEERRDAKDSIQHDRMDDMVVLDAARLLISMP
jgi:hypothetical protein